MEQRGLDIHGTARLVAAMLTPDAVEREGYEEIVIRMGINYERYIAELDQAKTKMPSEG